MPTDPRNARPPGMYVPPNNPSAVYDMQGLEFWDKNNVLRFWISRADTRAMVFDDAGVSRAEMGLLAANGNSPAQYGFRANDASGNPIFDSLGLIAVAKLLANSTLATASYVGTGVNNRVDMSVNEAQQATFTLARPASVLFLTKTTGFTSGGTGEYAFTTLSITGQALVGVGQFDKLVVGYTSDSSFLIRSLPAGTFVAKQLASAEAGQTLTTSGGGIDVILMGG